MPSLSKFLNSRHRLPILALIAIPIVTAVLMKSEGRLWWCKCGQWFLWTADGWSQHTSQHLFDPYSFTHVLHGILLWWLVGYWLRKRPAEWQLVVGTLIEAAWEVLENSEMIIERYRNATATLGYSGDTVANSVGDIVSCGIGFVVARRIGWRKSALIFIVIELVLVIWIRNSFVLELLMLTFPIEAVKQWQLGQ